METQLNQNVQTKEVINKSITIKCFIRRKATLPKGIPGESPLSRVYRLSSCMDSTGRGPLKGVTGILEKILMPAVVNVNSDEREFYARVAEYWNDISVVIPADEESFTKDKGLPIKFDVLITNSVKARLDKSESIEQSVKIIKKAIENNLAEITPDNVHNFLLLAFALERSTVANRVEDSDKSNKILFYISDNDTVVKQKLSLIQQVSKASALFNSVSNDDIKVRSILTLLKVDMSQLDSKEEMVIALHDNYTKPENVGKFLSYVEDKDLLFKYLITSAISKSFLREQPNTNHIYYNDTLLGKSVNEVISYLKSDDREAREILSTLEGELNIKVTK